MISYVGSRVVIFSSTEIAVIMAMGSVLIKSICIQCSIFEIKKGLHAPQSYS